MRRLCVVVVLLAAAGAGFAACGSERVVRNSGTSAAGSATGMSVTSVGRDAAGASSPATASVELVPVSGSWSEPGAVPGTSGASEVEIGVGAAGNVIAGRVGGRRVVHVAIRGAAARCEWNRVRVPPLTQASLNAVDAHSQDDVWIVGSQGEDGQERTLVLHYDGQSVQVVPSPSPFPISRLSGVVTFGPSDVWAVGSGVSTTEPHFHSVPLVLRYDGEGWNRVPVPAVETGFGAGLSAVAGASPDDVWAVGFSRPDEGDSGGFIEHWDGRDWRIAPSPRAAGYQAVTAVSPDDIWAAGSGDDDSGLAAHWDGGRWALVEDATGPFSEANGVSASDPNNVWIVGQYGAGPFAERFNGEKFAYRPIPYSHFRANYENRQDSHLADVEVISRRNIWAVGNFGIEHYNGRRWQLKSRARGYRAIAAATPADIWAAGGAKVTRLTCRQ